MIVLPITNSKLKKLLDTLTIDKLYELKEYYDDEYYNTGECSLDDSQYDLIVEHINKHPNKKELKVGAKLRNDEVEVVLPFYMGSMNKIKPEDTHLLSKWINEEEGSHSSLIISDKLDGVSCLLYANDDSVYLYTRADGTTGKDISYIKKYINHIPKTIQNGTIVRGELVLSKNAFTFLKSQEEKEEEAKNSFINARNTVSGAVKAKVIKKALEYIDFVAYELINPNSKTQYSISKQFTKLKRMGFRVVNNITIDANELTMENLSSILAKRKEKGIYEIDGIIVHTNKEYERNVDRNPKYAFAFKQDFSGVTTVKSVEWSITRHGVLKPVVHIEPIQLGGATISKATGYNAMYIQENKIGPNAIVEIVRSGEVIPKIIEVIQESENPDFPTIPYKWGSTNVDIYTVEKDTNDQVIKSITHFMTTMKIKYVSEATVKKLVDSKYDTIEKILKMEVRDFLKLEGFKDKLATRTYESIHESLCNVELHDLMAGSDCFGHGIGVKRMKSLLKSIPNLLELEINTERKRRDVYESVLKVEGFSTIMSTKVIEGIPKFNEFLKSIEEFVKVKAKSEELSKGKTKSEVLSKGETFNDFFKGKEFVCSGFRNVLDDEIKERGGEIADNITKNTFCLIVKEKGTGKETGKVKKAIEKGIPVYTIEEIRRKM